MLLERTNAPNNQHFIPTPQPKLRRCGKYWMLVLLIIEALLAVAVGVSELEQDLGEIT